MINKRLVGVVTVKDGLAVQSFGYRRYLPLGRPEVLIENLDRWGADEILIQCIDRTKRGLGPDFALLEAVGRRGFSTPLIYAGGIRNAGDAVDVVQAAADRVVVDALIHDSVDAIAETGARLGNQAIIGSLPLALKDGQLQWLDYRDGRYGPLSDVVLDALRSGIISEALVIDWRHEGLPAGFDVNLLDALPVGFPTILFGGISTPAQVRQLLNLPRVTAVAVGNFLSYREHAIQDIKKALPGTPVRPAAYQQTEYL